MIRTPLFLALAAMALPAADAATGPDLTLYSGDYESLAQYGGGQQGYALVRQTHRFDLQSGANRVSLSGLPRAIDVAGAVLRPLGNASVGSQRFDFALAGQDALLERAIGQTVIVDQVVGNQRERVTGTLLAAGNGLTLALPDGRIRVLSGYSGFELAELPEGLNARPTLNWQVQAPRAGAQDFVLDYPTGGLAWRAEYLATVSGTGTGCRLDLAGAAQVVNRSGADFRDASLSLVAGEPNRVKSDAPRMRVARAEMMMADAAPAPEPQASGEYHAYRIPGRIDLPDGSIQRVPLMAEAKGASCERRYETRSPAGWWSPPQPLVQQNLAAPGAQPVEVRLAFTNDRRSGLGQPLPAGRVRVFEADGALLGEASLGHTAAGSPVELSLGTVFDLNADRRQASFSLDRSGRTLTESFEVVLRNAKPEAATVRVLEVMPRWTDWEITEASGRWTQVDGQSARFDVAVPAGGEATLRYTVRYRWAPDVRIP